MNLSNFATLALAQEEPFIVRTEFTSNVLTMYLLRCDLLDDVLDATTGILRGFKIRIETVSSFDFRDNTDDGIANIASIDHLIFQEPSVSILKVKLQALRNILLSEANKVTYPLANTTKEEFAAAKAKAAIKKQECTYSNGIAYESASSNQGLDILINTNIDCDFVAYLSVCDESDDPKSNENYFPVGGERPITIPVKSINGRLKIALSAKKVRAFNKLYIKPSMACVFTANVKTNRG